MAISNELQISAFVSGGGVTIKASSVSSVWSKSYTSPELNFKVHGPGRTGIVRSRPNSLRVIALPKDTTAGNWRLKSLLLIQIRSTRRESVATTWLEGMAEYGSGKGESEAIVDLLVSLGDYRESLEKHEKNLGDSARKELGYLRKLVERVGK